jgi:hypothetical protein
MTQQAIIESFNPLKTCEDWWTVQQEAGEYSKGEIPYHRYWQPTPEEYKGEKFGEFIKAFGEGDLYENVKQLRLDELFLEPLWHPGPQDQTYNRCVPDAINMYFGGPLWDKMSKFVEYYTYNMKMKKEYVPEDMALKGVSLANLHNLVVLRDDKVAFNTKSAGLFDENMI